MFSDHNNTNAHHNTTAYHNTTAAMGRPPGEPLGMHVAAVGFPSKAGAGTRVPARRFALLVQKYWPTGTKVLALGVLVAAVRFPSEAGAQVRVCVYRIASADVARVQDVVIVRTHEALLVQTCKY